MPLVLDASGRRLGRYAADASLALHRAGHGRGGCDSGGGRLCVTVTCRRSMVSGAKAGVISAQDAQAALAHMTVASEAGIDTPEKAQAFLDGVLLGKDLKFRPERGIGG